MRRKLCACEHSYEIYTEKSKKVFACEKCGNRIAMPVKEELDKIETVIPVTKLNALAPSVDLNCIKFGHQWHDRTRHQLNSLRFSCLLCNTTIKQEFETDEEMQIIDEKISIKLGQQFIRLAKDVEYFFHFNRNKNCTIQDFMEFYQEYRKGSRIVAKRSSLNHIVFRIVKVLLAHSYIKLISDHVNPLRKAYMRQLRID